MNDRFRFPRGAGARTQRAPPAPRARGPPRPRARADARGGPHAPSQDGALGRAWPPGRRLTPYPRRGFRSEPSMAVGVRLRTPRPPPARGSLEALHGSPDSSEWEEAPVLSVNYDFSVNLTDFCPATGTTATRRRTHSTSVWIVSGTSHPPTLHAHGERTPAVYRFTW